MWALVNLILSVAGLILAIAIGICVLLQRKKKQKKTQTNNEEEEPKKQKNQHRNFWLATTFAMGIAGIIVFFLTEDLNRTMGLVDNWTIVNVIMLVVEVIAVAFVFKYKKHQQNSENPNTVA
jgi:heme/copper-type cytochrome/quinol oxidase subunit 2